MQLLLYVFWAIPNFIAMLPLIVLYHIIVYIKNIGNNLKSLLPHIIATYIFYFNLAVILTITGIPSVFDIRLYMHINFIPFINLSSNYIQYVQNIILFVPLGFMLPMLCKSFEKRHLTFITGFLFSFVIETLQLFSYRTTDIDDLLMNTIGTVAGYFIFTGIKRVFLKISIFSNDNKLEIYLYFTFALTAIFFIAPLVLNWFS